MTRMVNVRLDTVDVPYDRRIRFVRKWETINSTGDWVNVAIELSVLKKMLRTEREYEKIQVQLRKLYIEGYNK